MLRSAVAAVMLAGIARADAPALPSTEGPVVANLADAKWAAPKNPQFPPGLLSAPIALDPSNGANIGYAKFPPGYVFPLHTHNLTEYTALISGKMDFTIDGKLHHLVPGSYVVIPPKTRHTATCSKDGECILLTRRPGPADYDFIKP